MAEPELWLTVTEAPFHASVMLDLIGPDAHHLGAWLRRLPFDKMVERAFGVLSAAFEDADQGMAAISSGRFGFRPELAWVRDLAAKALRAALNEGGG